MDLRSEAPAVIVRLRAATAHAYMRELAGPIRALASLPLEIVADFVFMKFLVKVRTKFVEEPHKIIEVVGSLSFVFGSLTLARSTTSTTSPVSNSSVFAFSSFRRNCISECKG